MKLKLEPSPLRNKVLGNLHNAHNSHLERINMVLQKYHYSCSVPNIPNNKSSDVGGSIPVQLWYFNGEKSMRNY